MQSKTGIMEMPLNNHPSQATYLSDEACLEAMRRIVKEYVSEKQKSQVNDDIIETSFKESFDTYRQMIRDEAMRSYTAFEFMEKLYWQEYLIQEYTN